jgi:hypothetical protein
MPSGEPSCIVAAVMRKLRDKVDGRFSLKSSVIFSKSRGEKRCGGVGSRSRDACEGGNECRCEGTDEVCE